MELNPSPSCPRCGYDLSGAAGVRDGAPTGTCSECGLAYNWRDVLDPDRGIPRWFVEGPFSFFPIAALRTWLGAAFKPWRFWRRVHMHFPARVGRLVGFVLVALVLTHFALGAVPLIALLDSGFSMGMGILPHRGEYVGLLLNPYVYLFESQWFGTFAVTYSMPRTADASLLLAAGVLLLMPLTPLLLRETLGRFKVRTAHIWRVWSYSLAMIPIMAVLHASAVLVTRIDDWWGWMGAGGGPPGVIGRVYTLISGPLAAIHAVLPLRLACLILSISWIGLFWYWAVSRYLRLPHAGAIAAAGVVIAGLITAILAMIFSSVPFFGVISPERY